MPRLMGALSCGHVGRRLGGPPMRLTRRVPALVSPRPWPCSPPPPPEAARACGHPEAPRGSAGRILLPGHISSHGPVPAVMAPWEGADTAEVASKREPCSWGPRVSALPPERAPPQPGTCQRPPSQCPVGAASICHFHKGCEASGLGPAATALAPAWPSMSSSLSRGPGDLGRVLTLAMSCTSTCLICFITSQPLWWSRRPGQLWRPQHSPAAGDMCAAGPRAVGVQAELREQVTGDGGARGPAGAVTLLTGTPATRPSLPPRKGPSGYGQSHPFVPPSKPGPVTCFRHPRDAGSERQSLRRTWSGPAPAILGPECPAPDTPTLRGHRRGALLLAQSADTAADDFVGVAGCQTPCWVLRT